jgi:hypothetical protein
MKEELLELPIFYRDWSISFSAKRSNGESVQKKAAAKKVTQAPIFSKRPCSALRTS